MGVISLRMVGVARLELAASWSRTMRATSCATPRYSLYIIMIQAVLVKQKFSAYAMTLKNIMEGRGRCVLEVI